MQRRGFLKAMVAGVATAVGLKPRTESIADIADTLKPCPSQGFYPGFRMTIEPGNEMWNFDGYAYRLDSEGPILLTKEECLDRMEWNVTYP